MAAVYLDNQATTRCDPRVVEAMMPHFGEAFGNASSRSHRYGLEARAASERARGQVAALIGASPKEVVFTSGATESDNLAILGGARARRAASGLKHVVTVATEHKAVLDPVAALAREGFDVTVLPVGPEGLLDVDRFVDALTPQTALASVMLVNNEIGVMQDIAVLGALCRDRGIWLHCDAAQAAAVSIDVGELGVDLLSLSSHKIYGPMGVGALYLRRTRPRVLLEPLVHGGGHERGLRSGTLPVPLVVGFGVAAELARAAMPTEAPRIAAQRDRLWEGLRDGVDGLVLNGHATRRTPQNLHIAIDGVEAEALLMALRDEVALSTGSACSSETLQPSHVLRALHATPGQAQSSVRFGLGRFTTDDDIGRAISSVIGATVRLRAMSSLYEPG